MQSLVRRMLQRQMARFVKQNFHAWREEARKLRELRIKAVDSWRGYGRLLCLGPFQGWASYVKGVKNVNNERQRIVSSYLRWKWRQRIVIIEEMEASGIIWPHRWTLHETNVDLVIE